MLESRLSGGAGWLLVIRLFGYHLYQAPITGNVIADSMQLSTQSTNFGELRVGYDG